MVVAAAVGFARLVVGLGRTLHLIALVALRADIVLTRRAVVLPVAIVVPEIAAVVGAGVSVAKIATVVGAGVPVVKIAAVIVATSVIRVVSKAFAAIIAAYVAAIVEVAGARRRCDVRAAVIE